MVARLQRLLVFVALAAAVLWGWGWWAHSPAVALGGLLLLLAPHALVLGAEFLVMRWVNRTDAVPRASGLAMLRAWRDEVVYGWRVFAWRQPFRAQAIADDVAPRQASLRGVVLVHGFVGNRGFWTPWLARLREDGRAFVAVTLEPITGAIDGYVPAVAAAVARVAAATGGQAPLVVAHSMGGLAVRAWLRAHPDAVAHRVVTIGTPHHGTSMARHARAANGRQMRRGNAWLARLAADEAERPERVARYVCWYSDCDNIVFPASTAMLAGADNRLVAGRPHVGLAFDPQVLRETLALADVP